MTIVFFVINKTIGLRVSEEEEIKGLDDTEHNLPSAYADFMPAGLAPAYTAAPVSSSTPAASVEKAVPVETYTTNKDAKLNRLL